MRATGSRRTEKMTLRVASILWLGLLSAWPAQLDAFITQNTGCRHNGTWYADKSIVPSMEKCLNCQCNRKTLVCRLKVCPEMPMPPPRGCVVVQKKNTCCPYLSCARLDAFYKIPTKRRIIAYLDHYERESIDRVVNDNMLQRRSDDSEGDLFVCVKNGTVYKSGSAMSSSNLCSYCYCIGGTEKCVKPKCMLPVEGCKPIFVDSTCCPVRYDCSSKTSGKSSQEVRYRKTANKHFQRMSQRLQRNRGCTVDSQFYAEGQKMRSDADRPCDICFCIRGTRRCAPKKCSPALKNCIPVVPKGQCCPSSYDCGSQRDYRRSQNSRQFNLYSILFGKEEQEPEVAAATALNSQNTMAEHYPLDRHPTEKPIGDALLASSEKSILDTLREGLEYIDSNNNKMLTDNMDLVDLQSSTAAQGTTEDTSPAALSTTTELSFLDLLLGPSTEREGSVNPETSTIKKPMSWVDILLGPDDEEPALAQVESTTRTSLSSIDRITNDFDKQIDELPVGELPAAAQQMALANSTNWSTSTERPTSSTSKPPSDLLNVLLDGLSVMLDNNVTSSSISAATTATTSKPNVVRLPPMFRPLPSSKPQHTRINSKLSNLTVTPPMLLVTSIYGQPVTYITVPPKTSTTKASKSSSKPSTTTAATTRKPSKAAVKPKPKTTRRTTTVASTSTTTVKTTTRTTQRMAVKTKPPINITTSSPPIIIKTNPSILEAEPMDESDSTSPTLPPSLPNLKIIPFLPTDAVDAAAKTNNNNNFYAQTHVAADKMDVGYDTLYDDSALHYPAITSAQPLLSQLAGNSDQAAYKYEFNVEMPAAELPSAADVHVGSQYQGSADILKYDFEQQVSVPAIHSGFSPPTETEGGFVPKDPLFVDGDLQKDLLASKDNYHFTQHIIDITTKTPIDTSAIEISTSDKDEVYTESPTNLSLMIVVEGRNTFDSTPKTTTITTTTTTPAATTTISTTTKPKLQLENNEISELDKLLDELLSQDLASSTVPPFKTLPTIASSAIPITVTKKAPTTATPFPTRVTKNKNNKTKTKLSGNRRNSNATTPFIATTKPMRYKGPPATRRTATIKNKNNTNNTVAHEEQANVKTQITVGVTTAATKKPTTTAPTPTTTTTKRTTTAKPSPTKATETSSVATEEPLSSTVHPFLKSPFDKLPFMDASYEVRPYKVQPQQQLQLAQEQQPQQFHHYQHATSSSNNILYGTSTDATVTSGVVGMGGSPVGLIDPTGMLKLAGCNIYGRMYRVGRIIVELSNQCLECKCTEVGVKCGPLDC
ncbi:mucin-5AC [Drosophila busckii]|uniref:mucin-5AC n=1 Tax=Drosophila busckii TaxID=30019 RepID=UPI001432AFD1|nr:mucin-5AC [Drosophila busckii]